MKRRWLRPTRDSGRRPYAAVMSTVLAVSLVALAAAFVDTASATDFYVRPSGDDSGSGTQAQPFATVGRGLDALGPGDTLLIGAGVYHEGDFCPEVPATPNDPVTIRNVPGERPVLDGDYRRWQFVELVEQDGFVFRGLRMRCYRSCGISLRHCGYVTIAGCESYDNGAGGIELNHASFPGADYDAHITVEGCVCYRNGWGRGWSSGIHLNNKGEGGVDSHHIIRRNTCFNNADGSDHHTDGNGIMFDVGGGGSCLIENNVCYNNGGAGIRVMDGRANVVNNTCYRNGWDRQNAYRPPELELIERWMPGAVAGSVVRNNILWARRSVAFEGERYGGPFGLDDVDAGSIVFDHNLL